MSARRITTVATLIALAALGAAFYQRHRMQAAESSVANLAQKTQLAKDELARLSAHLGQLAQAEAQLRYESALAQAQRSTPDGAPNPTLNSEDPALLRQAVVKAHAAAALRYRALFQSLKLEPEKAQKLEGLVEDYELHARDIWEEGNAKGIATTDPALWELMRPDYEKMKADVTALVGEAGFQQVDQYNRSLVGRDFSTALAASLYYTDTPLTAQQTSDLVQTFANLSPGYQQGHSAIDLYTMDWTNSYPQLGNALAPAQLAALQTVVAARQAYVKLSPLVGASIGYVVNAAAQKPAASGR